MVSAARVRGFSLVELMVVVAIGLLVGALAVPMGSSWSAASKVQQTTHRLQEAMGRAKGQALMNTNSATADTPAAVMVVTGSSVCVYSSAPAGMNCTGSVAWQTPIAASVTLGGASPQCVALNNRGLVVSATVGATACTTDLAYAVSSANERFPSTGTQTLN